MTPARLCVLLLLTATSAVAAPAPRDEWPEFRGPTGQGHTTATGLPLEWSAEKNVVWKQPVPGTGGRLGSAAFVAVLALPGRAALNWGAQGIRPAGRHLGLIGDTAALPVAAVLAAVPGIVDPYGAPGKACGGYVPVG